MMSLAKGGGCRMRDRVGELTTVEKMETMSELAMTSESNMTNGTYREDSAYSTLLAGDAATFIFTDAASVGVG